MKKKLKPDFKPKRLILALAPLAALLLELLPYGVVLIYALPNGSGAEPLVSEYERHLYSYFDLFPFSYGNSTPFVTAIFTCAVLLAVLIYTVFGRWRPVIIILSALDFLLSILPPILLGIDFSAVLAVFISIIIFSEIVIAVKLKDFTQ